MADMRTFVRRFLLVFAFFLSAATGCAEAQVAPSPKIGISGQSVFVYSFLDLFPKSYTPPVTDQIVNDLGVALKYSGVDPTIREFRKSNVGNSYPFPKTLPIGTVTLNPPIEAMILEDYIAEKERNTKYRLIIFPTMFKSDGPWRFYDISWTLISIDSGMPIWNYTYHGSHMSILRNSENKVKRSRKIVDAAVEEMKKAGII
ncbi:hypothetical protein ACQKO5_13865 [Novosphingobium subterraneum]|uniref:hypothetical protein n=1 Tax=Novosphingobium subterraneum TaxID=48936 RepID=UPI003CFCB238